MQRISFAPELSATLRRVSCWITFYLAFSTISSTRQRFSLEMGRVSVMRTRSPTPHSFFSSWTLNFVLRWTVLRYRRGAFEGAHFHGFVFFLFLCITLSNQDLSPPWGS